MSEAETEEPTVVDLDDARRARHTDRALLVISEIESFLADVDPELVGAVLASLTVTWAQKQATGADARRLLAEHYVLALEMLDKDRD
jgi:hypothetical protein